jgi:polyisoprenoid-binding protein YceI
VLRRDILRIGLSVFTLSVLVACGSVTAAPSPTPAPSATTVATTEATVEPTAQPSATEMDSPISTPTTSAMSTDAMTATMDAGMDMTTTTSSGQLAVFQIDPNQTKVLFVLGETLLGKHNVVTGTATTVSGAITLTLDNPASSTVGPIQIDATSFATDSGMRDRMIRQFILKTQDAQYQYITFEPTSVEGLPATVNVGDEIPLKISGNLKVLDMVKPVTFDATVTLKSDTELAGSATSSVTFADFGVSIPQVPSVTDVTPDVTLEIQFVATKQ